MCSFEIAFATVEASGVEGYQIMIVTFFFMSMVQFVHENGIIPFKVLTEENKLFAFHIFYSTKL